MGPGGQTHPHPKTILARMSVKSFRTPSLMQDDVLCHFSVCKKKVWIERDIGRSWASHFHFFTESNLLVCHADNKIMRAEMHKELKLKKAEAKGSKKPFPESH